MTIIAPWISVPNGLQAIEFYKSALGAREISRVDAGDDVAVARFSIGTAEFWISVEPLQQTPNGGPIRLVLYVDDPDAAYRQALTAGATQVYPVHDEHGWRVGRFADPFGHHWEVARQLTV